MADAPDEEEMNSPRDSRKYHLERAYERLSPGITRCLDRVAEAERITVLVKAACGLACLVAAGTKSKHPVGNDVFFKLAERALAAVMMDLVPKPRGEELEVSFGPSMKAAMAADPKTAEAVADVIARIRQALDGVATGKFANEHEAMSSLGGKFIDLDDFDPDDGKGTLQ